MKVSVEVHKIIKCTISSTIFFTLGGGVDDKLVRLPLIEQIIKDVNLMCISFSVKHPQYQTSLIVCWCPFVTIFKYSNLQSHYTFFQLHQIVKDIVPILYNKPCICTGD